MGNFYEDTIKKHKDFKSTKVISSLDLLEPTMRCAVEEIIKGGAGKFMVYETYRSKERQEELFNKKPPVTKLKTVGVHHFGLAADIVISKGGKPSWDGKPEDWKLLKKLAVDAGIISGQDWGEPGKKHEWTDEPHVQRIMVAHQKGLFAGKWYPDDKYDPWDKATWPK